MVEKFLSLEKVSVQMGDKFLLDNLDLTIHRGEQWVITGPSGSGKTLLAHTLAGRHFYTGRIGYYFGGSVDGMAAVRRNTIPGEDGPSGGRIVLVDQLHRFKNLVGAAGLYYQQRFNASDADQTITVAQELREYTTIEGPVAEEWMDRLHVRSLLSRPLIQLSNGENKRVQLAIALLEDPELLILDNPFLGLDTAGRALLHQIINGLAEKGIQILLLMTGMQDLPESITHIARLEKGKWVYMGLKGAFQNVNETGTVVHLDPDILAQLRGLPGED